MALLVGTLMSSGCFTYVPVSLTSVPPREEVRVRITDDAGARLVRDLGTYTTVLEGEVAPQGDSVSITVPIVREYRGTVLESARQVLYLGQPEVVEIRRRQFSRSRTVLTSVGALVAFGGLVGAIIAIADPNPGSEDILPPPPPPGASSAPRRLPFLIQIRIP